MAVALDEPDNLVGWNKKQTAVDIVYLDFRKAFNTASHKILIGKLLEYGLDGQNHCHSDF